MKLYFLRHGVAEEARHGMSDEERALTGEGRTELAQIAKGLQRLAVRPTTIFASPLVRTRETAEIVAAPFSATVTLAPELVPGCTFDQLQRLLRRAVGQQVLLVGHSPDLGQMAATLLGAAGSAISLPKAGLVRVDFDGQPVAGIARLRYMLTPQQLVWIGAS